MNIILGDEAAERVRERHTVLPLEVIQVEGRDVRAYCVLTADSLTLGDMPEMASMVDLHENMVRNFERGDANYVEQAIENLMGKFNGELDSFYEIVLQKLNKTKTPV